MPIYDWKCNVCEHVWEEMVKIDESPKFCPVELGKHLDLTDKIERHHHIEWPKDMGSKFKKLPSVFGKHVSWSNWRILDGK